MGVPARADMTYTYCGTRMLNNREIAYLHVTGPVRGLLGAGLNVSGAVEGGNQVALDSGEVLSATLNFKADMDFEFEHEKAKLFGTSTVRVRRTEPSAAKPATAPTKKSPPTKKAPD